MTYFYLRCIKFPSSLRYEATIFPKNIYFTKEKKILAHVSEKNFNIYKFRQFRKKYIKISHIEIFTIYNFI